MDSFIHFFELDYRFLFFKKKKFSYIIYKFQNQILLFFEKWMQKQNKWIAALFNLKGRN